LVIVEPENDQKARGSLNRRVRWRISFQSSRCNVTLHESRIEVQINTRHQFSADYIISTLKVISDRENRFGDKLAGGLTFGESFQEAGIRTIPVAPRPATKQPQIGNFVTHHMRARSTIFSQSQMPAASAHPCSELAVFSSKSMP
jgi:hypothetical protein